MIRHVFSCVALLLTAVLASAAPAPEEGEDRERAEVWPRLVRVLKSPVNFSGFEKDERVTLRDALEQLNELYDLPILVNEEAFRQDNVPDVLETTPVAGSAFPKMAAHRLEVVLNRLLTRIPSNLGTTYIVRERHVEITTVPALRKEFRLGPDAPPPALAQATINRLPLTEALEGLAGQTGRNVVIDVRAGEKAKTPVTAKFNNVPLETAVRLLADMVGLKMVPIDNVLYVTTADNAKVLQDEEEKRTLKQIRSEKPEAVAK